MENKKTFGAFILQRRRDLGMTQKEFAEKLYVTESAVSKWERGLSYPDITLIRSICAVLDISEHELLTGAEDTETRRAEQLASRYLRLTKNYRVIQYILYGLALLVCAICNLAIQHTLSWFFIALFAVMTAASLTLLPAVTALHPKLEHYGGPIAFGSFTLSLLLLLLSCCLYTGGDWFVVAAAAVLFGLSLLFLPLFLPRLPLPAALAGRKTSAYLLLELFLLLLLLLICCLYTGGNWFIVAAVSVIFGLGFFILPVLLHQLPLPGMLRDCRLSVYLLVQTALLLLLLLTSCLYTGGDWFVTAAVAVVFGLGFFILPVLLHQLPLPDGAKPHKTLIYFAAQTLLLFLLLAVANIRSFLPLSLPISLICLLFPWGLMLTIRYLPVSPFFRASVCCAFSSLWLWVYPYALDKVMQAYYGEGSFVYFSGIPYSFPALNFDFLNWTGSYISANTYALILFSLLLAAIILAVLGLSEWRQNR